MVESFRPFDRSPQIQLIRVKNQAFGRNNVPTKSIWPPHVQYNFFVNEKLVVQAQVIAVGVQLPLIEWIDDDIFPQLRLNLVSGKDHENKAIALATRVQPRPPDLHCFASVVELNRRKVFILTIWPVSETAARRPSPFNGLMTAGVSNFTSLRLAIRLHILKSSKIPSVLALSGSNFSMFLDRVTIHVKGGDGGDGCMSFRREFKAPRGGPNGGDGGRGGDVVVRAEENVDSLAALAGQKHWRAEGGSPGQGSTWTGRNGDDVVILVPPGTLLRDAQSGDLLRDLTSSGDSIVVAAGGRGGHGNTHFKTATNRAPREFERGFPGEERKITLELKVIADVGLIGMPNAGKSTLLSRISRAHPEIADYPFTTKYPNLGMVQAGDEISFVAADIPGLIEGAHAGAGLGHEFLKHVERTKVLVHLVEPDPQDQTDPVQNYRQIHEELRLYDASLLERPEIVVVSKAELPTAPDVAELLERELGRQVLLISAVTGKGLPALIAEVWRRLSAIKSTQN